MFNGKGVVLVLLCGSVLGRAQMTEDFSFVMNGPQAGTLSPATGGQVNSGISFDTSTHVLSIDSVAFGSAFAPFVDLEGQFTHANLASETSGLVFSLDSMTTTDAGKHSGMITGQLTLNSQQQVQLLTGLDFINLTTTTFPDGEIRGQLIPSGVSPIPEPHLYALFAGLGLLGFAASRHFRLGLT
jgi:hypothetical protein